MKKHINIIDLEWDIFAKVKTLNAPSYLIPDFGGEESEARDSQPLIIFKDNKYCFLVYERGVKIDERKTPNKDEVIFWILETITHSMAFQDAADNCHDTEQRVCAFRKQIELLENIKVKEHFINALKKKYNTLVGFKIFVK